MASTLPPLSTQVDERRRTVQRFDLVLLMAMLVSLGIAAILFWVLAFMTEKDSPEQTIVPRENLILVENPIATRDSNVISTLFISRTPTPTRTLLPTFTPLITELPLVSSPTETPSATSTAPIALITTLPRTAIITDTATPTVTASASITPTATFTAITPSPTLTETLTLTPSTIAPNESEIPPTTLVTVISTLTNQPTTTITELPSSTSTLSPSPNMVSPSATITTPAPTLTLTPFAVAFSGSSNPTLTLTPFTAIAQALTLTPSMAPEILEPTAGELIPVGNIQLRGKAAPNTRLEIRLNNVSVAMLISDAQGNWETITTTSQIGDLSIEVRDLQNPQNHATLIVITVSAPLQPLTGAAIPQTENQSRGRIFSAMVALLMTSLGFAFIFAGRMLYALTTRSYH